MGKQEYKTTDATDRGSLVAWARQFKRENTGFPLTVLATGYWCKVIEGRQVTFGKLGDPNEAIAAYYRYLDGDDGQPGLTVGDGVNLFLAAMEARCEQSDLEFITWRAYERIGKRLIAAFGRGRRIAALAPRDFQELRREFAKTRTGKGMLHLIHDTRTLFGWLADNLEIDRVPDYGTEFSAPSKRSLRRIADAKPEKMLTPEQLRHLLDPATIKGHFRGESNRLAWRAMQLLGLNCGFTGIDCADLHFGALDLDAGTHCLPRSKTLERRKAMLWPETVEAIRLYLECRPKPRKGCDRLVLLNSEGTRWVTRTRKTKAHVDNVSEPYTAYLSKHGMHEKGNSFGMLRHICATIGRRAKEHDALELILGHVPTGMTAEYYLERVTDRELSAVTECVRQWLLYGS